MLRNGKSRSMPTRLTLVISLALVLASCAPAIAVPTHDWPAYRHDSARSGKTQQSLTMPLGSDWVFTPTHPPVNAWADPQPKRVEGNLELPRIRFDDAFHVAVAGDALYFGSSSDNMIYCLDANSGKIRWRFHTGGPVRLAPTVWNGKVYVGSDDGKVYCLDGSSGNVVWTFRAAPGDRHILGNGRMISVWPVRTGVLVEDGTAYFGAGVFPSEGLYLYAVNAKTGEVQWKNNGYGKGGMGSITPQGYLVASKDRLFVASGRAMPATFDRKTGKFKSHTKFIWRRTGMFGGTYSVLVDDLLLNGTERLIGVGEKDGKLKVAEEARRITVAGDVVYLLTGKEAVAVDRTSWLEVGGIKTPRALKKRPKKPKKPAKPAKSDDKTKPPAPKPKPKPTKATVRWRTKCACAESMALTPELLFAGGKDVVMAFDLKSGEKVWSAPVRGKARGLAVACGRLYVSTDKGDIHSFVPGKGGNRKIAPPIKTVVKQTPEPDIHGYTLILGGDGTTGLKYAQRSDGMIYMINPDAGSVASTRKELTDAGVCGGKVVVLEGGLQKGPLSDYFAHRIVSTNAETPAGEVLRMLKPCGGVAEISGSKSKLEAWRKDIQKLLDKLGEKGTKVALSGGSVKVTRGPLNGAGKWVHQYGEPGNTACGDDQLVRGPLGLLWYGEPGPGRMPSRHASAASPLAIGGKMFVQGENVIMAHDAYNGLQLWQRDIPGAIRLRLPVRCANFVTNDNSLFVATGGICLRLDHDTGRTIRTYKLPDIKGVTSKVWEYVACVGDTLYGSAGSNCIFAMDIESGKLKWHRVGKNIMTVTICIGDDQLFYVDRVVSDEQRKKCIEGVPAERRKDKHGKSIKPDVRLVVSLDAKTGKELWAKPEYISDCVVPVTRGAGDLTMMYSKGVVLLCGQPWNGHFWREFFSGGFSRRCLIALSGSNGSLLWSGRKGYRSRPLIVGDRIIAEPWAHDLRTGEAQKRNHPITGVEAGWQMARPGHHCGNIAACPNVLFFRSGITAWYDLNADFGSVHFGGQRPGCWINCIPANGLVMMPEASSGCVCPFPVQCTVVFSPQKINRAWGMFSAPGPAVPVKKLAINIGAPGDRKDSKGNLWISHPRPRTDRLVFDMKAKVSYAKGGGYYAQNADYIQIDETDDAWIYSYGCRGITKCEIPLLGAKDKPRKYRIRLHFFEPDGLAKSKRVFNVAIQGKMCLEKFDIGGPGKAVVKEFSSIEVKKSLVVELKPSGEVKEGATLPPPVLAGIEIIAE